MEVNNNIKVGQLVKYKQWNVVTKHRLFLVVGKHGRYLELSPVDNQRTDGRRWSDEGRLSVYV